MSSPVASAPVAVLVLAWDETTPAARVLVEATEVSTSYADSVVALVPTGPLANELSQEEFLPLAASPLLAELPTEPAATAEAAPLEAEIVESELAAIDTTGPPAEPKSAGNPPAPIEPSLDEPAPLTQAEILPATSSPAPGPAAPILLPAAPATVAAALVRPALVWQQVRVLRLRTPAPALVWDGTANTPAAPYLGSSELAAQPNPAAKPELETSAVAAVLLAATETAASALAALRTPELLVLNPLPPASEAGPAHTYLLEELPAAPDAESDAAPLSTSSEPGPLTAASTTELNAAAAPAVAMAVATAPVQAAEPAAPELLVPLAAAPPAAAEPEFFALEESGALAALRPAGQRFDAPDLNFQIIQYARLAVPRALAEQPFGVIYAPAWPTWLAAQELRHRSGQPLVLHLAQLAATDDELIDLAAGWVAEIQRQALHRADLILTETAALAQRLRHELGLPAHRVRAVPAADAAAVAQALRTAVRW